MNSEEVRLICFANLHFYIVAFFVLRGQRNDYVFGCKHDCIDMLAHLWYNNPKKDGGYMEDLQIILHIIELCLFLFSLFWYSQRNSRFIQRQPFKIMAIVTSFTTILGGVALGIYDIILFFMEL